MWVVSSRRYLTFNQIEILTLVLAFPSLAWFVIATMKFWDGDNNCRTKAFYLYAIGFILMMEALVFFVKLSIVVFYLIWNIIIMYIKDTYNEWQTRRQGEQAYESVLHDSRLKLKKDNIDIDDF
jgi:hypothetical protein